MLPGLFLVPVLAAVPGGAREAPAVEAPSRGPQVLPLHLEAMDLRLEHHAAFEPREILDPRYEREVRLALWNDPRGRPAWNLAAELSMTGRTGLVHGGHMPGVGLGTTPLGDGRSPTSRLHHGERSWRERLAMERFQVGAWAAMAAGFLWMLLSLLQ